jgi:hypothetical protein
MNIGEHPRSVGIVSLVNHLSCLVWLCLVLSPSLCLVFSPPCPHSGIHVFSSDRSILTRTMARLRPSCPPGVLCVSAGLSTILMILLAVVCVFLILALLVPSSLSSLSSPSSLSSGLIPFPPPASQQPPITVAVHAGGGGGGDSRYDRAPQPLRDWMAPPEFPPRGGLSRLPFNQPTQGLPESFQSVGLIRVEDKMLPLYGRRTAGSSDRWNYYTRTDTYNPIPLPIQIQKRDCMDDVGCAEVSSGDRVHVRGIQKEGQTEIYRFDGPKYLPGLL